MRQRLQCTSHSCRTGPQRRDSHYALPPKGAGQERAETTVRQLRNQEGGYRTSSWETSVLLTCGGNTRSISDPEQLSANTGKSIPVCLMNDFDCGAFTDVDDVPYIALTTCLACRYHALHYVRTDCKSMRDVIFRIGRSHK